LEFIANTLVFVLAGVIIAGRIWWEAVVIFCSALAMEAE
jgi:hypothetical protein